MRLRSTPLATAHTGTLAGAAWTTGRYGGGLSFNGSNAYVGLGTLGTFYQSAFTLEAWVQKQTATKNDVGILGTWAGSGPMLWVDHIATRYQLTLGSNGLSGYLDSGHNPIAGQWQHLAATYDGTTARYYIDGIEVASRTVSGSVGNSNIWRIGAYGTSPGGFFDGTIDDVRIYNRALSAGEVQFDMNQPVTSVVPPADTTPPTAPGTLAATAGAGRQAFPGAPRPTTSASRRTTSTGRQPRASPPRRGTGSRSRQVPRTRTPASHPAPTTTRSPPRTPPATSGLRPTRRAPRCSPIRRSRRCRSRLPLRARRCKRP